ncbi:MAG: chromosome partitioning protein ParB, partial [Gammaproteobacteria bacterium]|nr:chromosome partitioning protein ParB [Gammaproteobacteria bacterium]NIV51136.1 chromosome partitioning protein ParB [Gammaproteobacteria bacterium]NIX10367.1 chromosome partitioning protein ParB [Gammaproteobacteria bacterium]
ALLALSGAAQSEAARKVATRGLSVREAEQLARRMLTRGSAKPKPPP